MRLISKYGKFINQKSLNENLDKAKKFLKDRYLLTKAADELNLIKGELKAKLDNNEIRSITLNDFTEEEKKEIMYKARGLKLDPEQARNLEKDPDFVKLRELLKDNIGYLYNFTYMFYNENIPMEEIERLYGQILEYRDLLNNLPKKFDIHFIDTNISNNAEILEDGLDYLGNYRKIKKVFDRLTSNLKKEYRQAIPAIKEKFDSIAVAFYELGKDETEMNGLWDIFFGGIRRYKDLNSFIRAAESYLKSSSNAGVVDFYSKINECNDKLGATGVDVEFDEGGVLVLNVKSYQANKMINGHTRHCIVTSSSYWDSYVSNHNNKQYYYYDFNIPQHDSKSVIGITIEENGASRTAHDKADSYVGEDSFRKILKKAEKDYGIDDDIWSYFKPMSAEEIERRRRAKVAEREIVKKGITIEQIKQYVKEDGADINKNNGIALVNAVDEDDVDKVKTILELGASPNLKEDEDAVISNAKSLDVIKLLVSNGAQMTGFVFNNILDDEDALKYCLDAGMDPGFKNQLPFRKVCIGTWKSEDDTGESLMDTFKILLDYGAKMEDDKGRVIIVRLAAEFGRYDIIDYLLEIGKVDSNTLLRKEGPGKVTVWEDAINWVSHSRRIKESEKDKMIEFLKSKE